MTAEALRGPLITGIYPLNQNKYKLVRVLFKMRLAENLSVKDIPMFLKNRFDTIHFYFNTIEKSNLQSSRLVGNVKAIR